MRHRAGEDREAVVRPLDLSVDAARRDRPPHAVIDIGSNSVRLVVYDQLGRAPLPRFNEKSFCRLGEGLDETGRLAPEGIRRTLEALRRFRAICGAMRVGGADVIATEATRRAANGPELVAAIRRETGYEVRVLAGAEEATHAALGVISGFFRPVGLVGDMGGGSLELAEARDDHVGPDLASLPLGALPVQGLLARHGRAARHEVDRILAPGLARVGAARAFYAVGGGFRALASLHMAAMRAPIAVVHGHEAEARGLRDFVRRLWRMEEREIAALPGLPSRRAASVPAAALVMDRLLRALAPERVVFSALGVREGWLYAQLPVAEQYLDPLIEGAQAWGLPLARVPGFALALARWTAALFPGEEPAAARLRVAACAVSDICWRDRDDLRAVEGFRRVSHFPFVGIDHPERAWLAAVIHARYAGRRGDSRIARALRLLPPAALRQARILGLAMLVAYRYSGSVPEILASSRLEITRRRVTLHVDPAARAPDSEALTARLRLLADETGAEAIVLAEGG